MRPVASASASSALGGLVPEELGRLARMREAFEAIRLGRRLDLGGGGRAGHQRASASSRASTARPDGLCHRPFLRGRVDEHAAVGLGIGRSP